MLEIDNILISLQFSVRLEKANFNEINDLTFKSDRLLAKATDLSRHAIYRIQSDPAWANDVLAAWVA